MKEFIYSAFLFSMLGFTIGSCGLDNCIDGSLDSTTRTVDLEAINSIELDISATVRLTQGTTQEIMLRSSTIIIDQTLLNSRV